MIIRTSCCWLVVTLLCLSACPGATAAERSESFDKDPAWDARNHRPTAPPQSVKQDFGYSPTSHAGGKPGEIGGLIAPASEAAYYAKKIPTVTFEQSTSASGTFSCGTRPFHLLLGFFNADSVNEWRTPNSIAIRLNGRGDKFYAYVEYCTGRWHAGGDEPQSFPPMRSANRAVEPPGFVSKGVVHQWSLKYDPLANEGRGAVTATIDGETAICHLAPEHKAEGASFNRFGLLTVMKSVDTGGEVWLDDVTVNGEADDLSKDPGWEGFQNRRTYETSIVRPRFDIGFSPTNFAGGRQPGELGGVMFRGDCRHPERMTHYADRLEPLTLDKPLRASGKIVLRRGVSDSGVLLGFFDSQESTVSNPSQKSGLPNNFLGISTDAPSREGFYVAPTYRVGGDNHADGGKWMPPHIYPDGQPHDWTLEYSPPTAADGLGQITVTLDGQAVQLPMTKGHRQTNARFDRFGMISTWVDGNSQTIYFDDLTYTFRQD